MHEIDAQEALGRIEAWQWLQLTRAYNTYSGARIDHVRMRELWDVMGPRERGDVVQLLTHDHTA